MTTVRPARSSDAPRLAALAGELGYPAAPDEMAARLSRCLERPDANAILVAENGSAEVVGWVHVGWRDLLEANRRGELLGLVVAESARRRGVGELLMRAAEHWVAEQGLSEVVVRSHVIRAESHPFYERLGYTRVKSQHVYRKSVRATQE